MLSNRPNLLAVGALLWGLLLAGPGLAAPEPEEMDLKDWITGPVRYIARKEEVQAFRGLRDDRDRALFIERFWSRRDPNPETLANSFRHLFWERVAQANSNFVDSTKPGWLTDRGKVHILYGPPTEVQSDINLRTQGIPGEGYGVIRWIYEGRPSGRMDLNPIVVVPFVRDGSGEWRLSYDPQLSSVFFNPDRIRDPTRSRFERFLAAENSAPRSQLSVMLDLGRMQEVPPEAQVLLERVETAEAYRTHEFPVKINRYFHPDEQRTVVSITAAIDSSSTEARPAVIARFEPLSGDHEPRLLGEDSFIHVDRPEGKLAQGRVLLEPGEYILTVMVADPITVSTGLHRANVTIPPNNQRMRFSDVSWAEELEPLPYASLASYDEPFVVGPYRVLPKLDDRFRRGETIKLFFEVYDARPPLELEYQLEGRARDGRWVALGQPSTGELSTTSHAWQLPTGEAWPEGDYRIRVDARDSEGRLVSIQVPFTLEPAASP